MKNFFVCLLCAAIYLIPMFPFIMVGNFCKYIYKGCKWIVENCPLDEWALALRNRLLTTK